MEDPPFEELESRIGIIFTNRDLLRIAFTHGSVRGLSHGKGLESYRKLEFVGDAVIRLVTSEDAYENSKGDVEALHNRREELVPNLVLTNAAAKLDLRRYLIKSQSEDVSKSGRVLAKVYEALTGAIFLDKGYQAAADFVSQTLVKATDTGLIAE